MAQRSLYDLLNGEFASGNPALVEDAANPDAVVARQRVVVNFAGKDNTQSNLWETLGSGSTFVIDDNGLTLTTASSGTNKMWVLSVGAFAGSGAGSCNVFDSTGSVCIWCVKPQNEMPLEFANGFQEWGIVGNVYGNTGAFVVLNTTASGGTHGGYATGEIGLSTHASEGSYTITSTGLPIEKRWYAWKIENNTASSSLSVDGGLRATNTTTLMTAGGMQPASYANRGGTGDASGVPQKATVNYCEAYNT